MAIENHSPLLFQDFVYGESRLPPYIKESIQQGALYPGVAALDVGAASGTVSRYLADLGFCVTALEPDAVAYSLFLQGLSRSDRYLSLVTPLPLNLHEFTKTWSGHKFHYVIADRVISSLTPVERRTFFQDASHLCKPKNGALIFSFLVRPEKLTSVAEKQVGSRYLGSNIIGHYVSLSNIKQDQVTVGHRFTITNARSKVFEQVIEKTLYFCEESELHIILQESGFIAQRELRAPGSSEYHSLAKREIIALRE